MYVDKLWECAVAFNKLLDKEYSIIAGKKNNLIEICIFFEKTHFVHLIGIDKLNDIKIPKMNSTKLFDYILNGKLSFDDIAKSVRFEQISDRIEYFPYLEQMLDSEEIIIKYNRLKAKSSVQAQYILYSKMDNLNIQYFIDIDSSVGKYFGRTFFTRKDNLYLTDNPYIILKKVKILKLDNSDDQILFIKQRK